MPDALNPATSTAPIPAPTTKQSRLEALRKRREELDARIRQAEAAASSRERKDDMRLKVLLGAALLADCTKHPEAVPAVKAMLSRAVQREVDREFLKAKGWLSAPD